MQFLKVYQIYFKQEQLRLLDYIPYENKNCTVYFENTVIKDLIDKGCHNDSEFFGVVPYCLKEKIGSLKKIHPSVSIANRSVQEFSKQSFENILKAQRGIDVMSFQRHIPHDPITYADKFHANFSEYFKKIMSCIGYDWGPQVFKHVIYCNMFVAKRSIYQRYVTEMLSPAMDVMNTMPELMDNSGYPKGLPDNLKQLFGVNHYPYHTFLCERMLSYFININNLKCLHY